MSHVSRYLDPDLVQRLNQLQLTARSVVEGATTGLHRSTLRGACVEFRQHRFYAPGDEPRRIDWRVLARTDRPYVKEFAQETNLRGIFVLDCSGSMAYSRLSGSKYEYGARLVVALAYLMLAQSESIGLALAAEGVHHWIAPKSGQRQLSHLVDVLERSAPKLRSAPARFLQQVADRLERRSLVVVVSDMLTPADKWRQGIARLRHDRHECIVLRVLDRDEIEFPFRNWTRCVGLEGERPVLCEPAVARQLYLRNFASHRQELEQVCMMTNASFQSFTTDRPLIDSLTRLLHSQAGAG